MTKEEQRLGPLRCCLRASKDRLCFAGRYLVLATALNLVWEMAQLPLYTIWAEAPWYRSLLAAAHCTVGDLIIAAAALGLAVALVGSDWPNANYLKTATCTVVLGVAYTVFSEWLNLEVFGTWAYSALMPRLPRLGTGLAPVLQWLVVPTVSFVLLRRLPRRR